MLEFDVKVQQPEGIDMDVALRIININLEETADVRLKHGDMEVKASSIMSLLSLRVARDDMVNVTVDGGEEELVASKLKDVLTLIHH